MAVPEYNLTNYLPLLYKWRRPIGVVTFAGFLVSVVASLLLPNVYRSTAIFYPTTLPSLETTLNPELTEQDRLSLSMSSDDADRLISIGQSQPVLRHLVQQFRLDQHYGYPANDTASMVQQKVLEEFLYNYTIAQNSRSAVEVSFEDPDKYLAARVANSITQQIDSVNQQLTRINQQKIIKAYAQRQQAIQQELQKTQDSLLVARQRFGIFGSSTTESEGRPESRFLAERLIQTETNLQQAQATLKSYQAHLPAGHTKIITLTAEVKGLQAAVVALKSKKSGTSINLESYLAGSDKVNRLETAFKALQEEYQKARQNYEDAQLILSNQTSSLYVVQPATPALKKVKPIRWLIVTGATVVTFVLSVVVITLLEKRRRRQRAHLYA